MRRRLERIRELYLGDGEEEELWTRRHLVVLLRPALVTYGVYRVEAEIDAASSPGGGTGALGDVVIWIVLAWLAFKVLGWWYDVIFVTDRRIFEVKGLAPLNVYSMPLWKVTDMTFRRTTWGFFLGYGALILETAGQNQALDHINYLPKPNRIYKAVNSRRATFKSPRERFDTPRDGRG